MTSINWTVKDIIILLGLNLIASFIISDLILLPLLLKAGMDSLIAGTSIGLFLAIFAITSVYYLALKRHNLSWRSIGFFNIKDIKDYKKIIFLSTFVSLIAAISILSFMYSIVGAEPNARSEAFQDPTVMKIVIALVASIIISPFYEEILYRGFIYNAFRKYMGAKLSIVSNGLLFALVHLPSLDILPVNLINGFIFAWAYEKTKNIYVPIIIHALFNLSLIIIVLYIT